MADQSTQSIVVEAPAADVMAVIADFPEYPRWVAAAKTVEVLEQGRDAGQVVALEVGGLEDVGEDGAVLALGVDAEQAGEEALRDL